MAQSVEEGLRRMMVALGRAVEAAIGGAQRARAHVETRGGMQPILSVEGQLPEERVRQLIAAAEDRHLAGILPRLDGKRALEIGTGPARFVGRFLQQGSREGVGLEIAPPFTQRQGGLSRGYVVRGLPGSLPFQPAIFQYVLARLATSSQGDVVRGIKEIGRVLERGGQGTIVDYHPFGLYSKSGEQRLRPVESSIAGIADYYKICRLGGLRIVDLCEVFVDEALRSQFAKEELAAYRNLKGSPLLAIFGVYKPRGEGGGG